MRPQDDVDVQEELLFDSAASRAIIQVIAKSDSVERLAESVKRRVQGII